MSKSTAPATIESLEQARDAARALAAGHPDQPKVEAIRSMIVELKRDGSREARRAEIEAAAGLGVAVDDKGVPLSTGYLIGKLEALREKLQGVQRKAVQQAQEQLTIARRAAKAAQEAEAAEELSELNIEQLEAKRDGLAAERKRLKRQQRVVAVALSEKQAAAAAEALLAKLTPEEREALRQSLAS